VKKSSSAPPPSIGSQMNKLRVAVTHSDPS
jgi:hypothetical protein